VSLRPVGIHNKTLSPKTKQARYKWLKPVILATQEAVIRGIMVQSQSRQKVHKTLYLEKTLHKKKRGGAQGVGPEFKP
jgi:hypothetical protein